MRKLKLLIADSGEEFRMALADSLKDHYEIHTCEDGVKALECIRRLSPDLLAIDLSLNKLDGLSVLQIAAAGGYRPAVLAFVTFQTDCLLDAMGRGIVDCVIQKPCSLRQTARQLAQLGREGSPLSSGGILFDIFRELSIQTHRTSSLGLRECILMIAENPTLLITKHVYPVVAQMYGGEGGNVERNNRTLIQNGWEKGDRQAWHRYFPRHRKAPSNRVFIARMAEELAVRQGWEHSPAWRKSM